MASKTQIQSWFKGLQTSICNSLESLDGTAIFKSDNWTRKGGGGGLTRVMEGGALIEKGGVNFSAVYGQLPDKILDALGLDEAEFFASGVSIVLHPNNPYVPIIHMNVRYFEMETGEYWFGGGIDVTPHYFFKEDAVFFHEVLKGVCDSSDESYYPKFKQWADDYFYIKHRKETRGIGGIFFDRLKEKGDRTKTDAFEFVKRVGESFVPIYTELANRHRNDEFGEEQKQWQLLRRGRYVEFNLVYDKGTKFGLDTDGRIESILMSLPQTASWVYDFNPKPGSPEENTLKALKKGIDWV